MSRLIPCSTWFRCALVGVVVLCVMVAGLMAVSPELHEHLHHDAGHADHACLATMIASGGCENVTLTPLLTQTCVAWTGTVTMLRAQWVRVLFLDGGVLEHGPPAMA